MESLVNESGIEDQKVFWPSEKKLQEDEEEVIVWPSQKQQEQEWPKVSLSMRQESIALESEAVIVWPNG